MVPTTTYLLVYKCNFHVNPHVRLLVGRKDGWLALRLVCWFVTISLKGLKLHNHAPIEALVIVYLSLGRSHNVGLPISIILGADLSKGRSQDLKDL